MEDLSELSLPGRFIEPPDDWWVVMTDVVDSTEMIAQGRYKDVNLVGAAVIPALLDDLGEELPYVFNGDGALLLMPPQHRSAAESILAGLVALAQRNFDITLRAGLFSVGELRRQRYQLEVGRLRLFANRSLAQFRGTMIAEIRRRLKLSGAPVIMGDPDAAKRLKLNNLTCRWQQQPARNGNILSIFISPKAGPQPIPAFLELLEDITDHKLEKLNPVSPTLGSYNTMYQAIMNERRLHAQFFCSAFLRRLISILISVPLFNWGLASHFLWADHYVKMLGQHSDFRKLDDALCMVLDCTDKQKSAIMEHLEQAYQQGEMYYGVHQSHSSQITCYVESVSDAAHVHFVDGTYGGYVAAAGHLKQQMLQGNHLPV